MNQYNMGAGDHEDHDNNNNNNREGGGRGVQQVEVGGQVISRVMERPSQEQIKLQTAALKCPRCDSTNTKFCYYNNYSLSQPRHFCKACKRYWTRGGTLRNVPVGGGCRKNKRFRKPLPHPAPPLHLSNNNINSASIITSSAAAAGAASCSTTTSTNNTTSVLGGAGNSSSSRAGGSAPLVLHDTMNPHQFNPLFYGGLISDHHHQISNFPFSRYDDDDADFHHQQAENLGLGFSSSSSSASAAAAFNSNYNAKQQQQMILQDHLVANSNYPSLIGSSNGSCTAGTSSTISSLLMGGGGGGGGGDDQQKQVFGDNIFQSFNLPSFDHHQNMHVCKMETNGQFAAGLGAAGASNSHQQQIDVHHHHDHMGGSINDPSSSNSLIWSTAHAPTAAAAYNWLDPSSNIASSSVPSLI